MTPPEGLSSVADRLGTRREVCENTRAGWTHLKLIGDVCCDGGSTFVAGTLSDGRRLFYQHRRQCNGVLKCILCFCYVHRGHGLAPCVTLLFFIYISFFQFGT